MKPVHFDPNNHAPKVAPDDSWGDGDSVEAEAPLPYLPPRRVSAEKTATTADGTQTKGAIGLRIDSVISRSEPREAPPRLEVQEIGGSSIKRLDQALPRPEKVVYQGGFKEKPEPDPETEDKSGEGEDWGNEKRISPKMLLIMGGSVLAFIILALILQPYINPPMGKSSAPSYTVVDDETLPGTEAMDFLFKRQVEATRLYLTYLHATRVEDIIPLIKNGEGLKSILLNQWRPRDIPTSWTPDSSTIWSLSESSNPAYGVLEGTLPDQSRFAAYFVQNGSKLLLDWKATVAFSTATFDELSHATGDGSEIRGTISSSPYYDPVWPEEDYISYRLTAAKENLSIWCYARRGQTADLALAPLFRQGEIVQDEQMPQRVSLRLVHGPNPTQPNQWLIQELLQSGWLTTSPITHE